MPERRSLVDGATCAYRWWLRGAEFGNKWCVKKVATCLLQGQGTAKDEIQADAWLEKILSPLEGHDSWSSRAHELAQELMSGRVLPRLLAKGVYWLRRAAGVDDYPHATFALGMAYATGCGVPQNKTSAEDWWIQCIAKVRGIWSSSAKVLLALHWVLWRDESKYEAAQQVFRENEGDSWGVGEMGTCYLQYLGYLSGTPWVSYLYKAQRADFYWAHELEADISLAKPHIQDNLSTPAGLALKRALETIAKQRDEGSFIGEAEQTRLQEKLDAVQAMKPLGLVGTLIAKLSK